MSCDSDCKACKDKCAFEKLQANDKSKINKVIGVVSAKGGVGKSYVTTLFANALAKKGYKVGILDADLTGPSIPASYGLHGMIYSEDGVNIEPAEAANGVKVVSMNLLMEHETDPLIWRGPMLMGVLRQFYQNVNWGELDYLLVDMPPGTSDIQLSIYQLYPLNGLVIVTSSQELVDMIVQKAFKMAGLMHIKVYGLVENMAYFICDECQKKHYIFGAPKAAALAEKFGVKDYAALALKPENTRYIDLGQADILIENELDGIVKALEE